MTVQLAPSKHLLLFEPTEALFQAHGLRFVLSLLRQEMFGHSGVIEDH